MQTNLSNSTATVWSQPNCAACDQAKRILQLHKIPYSEKTLGTNATKKELLELVPDARSVPQIFIDDKYIGGINELIKALAK